MLICFRMVSMHAQWNQQIISLLCSRESIPTPTPTPTTLDTFPISYHQLLQDQDLHAKLPWILIIYP